MSAASKIVKFGAWSFAIPLFASIVGFMLQYAIPGCHCDEGSGCRGCWILNDFIALLILGGFSVMIVALLGVLPICVVVGTVLMILAKPPAEDPPVYPRVDDRVCREAASAALGQFRAGTAVTEKCPACQSTLDVRSYRTARFGPYKWGKVECKCGRCSGTLEFPADRA